MRRVAILLGFAFTALLVSPPRQAAANALPYYWLPWTAGESRLVTQGNNEGTHRGVSGRGLDALREAGGNMTALAKGG